MYSLIAFTGAEDLIPALRRRGDLVRRPRDRYPCLEPSSEPRPRPERAWASGWGPHAPPPLPQGARSVGGACWRRRAVIGAVGATAAPWLSTGRAAPSGSQRNRVARVLRAERGLFARGGRCLLPSGTRPSAAPSGPTPAEHWGEAAEQEPPVFALTEA